MSWVLLFYILALLLVVYIFLLIDSSLLIVHLTNYFTGMTTNERFSAKVFGMRRDKKCGINEFVKFWNEKGIYEEDNNEMMQIPLLSINK